MFPIRVPPLRERTEDIAALAAHFIAVASRRFGRAAPSLDAVQVRALQRYGWPGNVRELQSVIDRAVILADGDRLPLEAALPELRGSAASGPRSPDTASGFVSEHVMRERDRVDSVAALEHAEWKVSGDGGAANLLGLKASTLSSRMRSLWIARKR